MLSQVRTDVSVDSKHQTIQGISFPISNDALQKLQELKDGRVNYVQLVGKFMIVILLTHNTSRIVLTFQIKHVSIVQINVVIY